MNNFTNMNNEKSILAVGSLALDNLETINGNRKSLLGGSSTYFGVASGTGTNGVNKPAFLVKDVAIPESSTIELLSGNKIFLGPTDELKIQCDTAAGFNTILSFVEQT